MPPSVVKTAAGLVGICQLFFKDTIINPSCAAVNQALLSSARNSITSSWEVAQSLLSDMAAVTDHLRKMGWEVHMDAAIVHSPPSLATLGKTYSVEDGDASLVKAALGLRLQFSYITEALQQHVSKSRMQVTAPLTPTSVPSLPSSRESTQQAS